MDSDGAMVFRREQVMRTIVSRSKKDALNEVIDGCSVFSLTGDIERFRRAVFRRERVATTGIGHGVAIAHGKILGLRSVLSGLGFSREGVDYGSLDGKSVHLLFVIASSPATQMLYLKTLCRILDCVRKPAIRAALDEFNPDAWERLKGKLESEVLSWMWREPMPTLPPR